MTLEAAPTRGWTLLTSHGRVLLLIAQNPDMRLRDIAEQAGITERSAQAIVADLVPDARRGSAYGIFTAVYGLAWLAGSVMIGLTYERSVILSAVVVTVVQGAALVVFLVARPHHHHAQHVRG